MIPKKIHYCWFGGEKNTMALKCIESWKKYCPDYEIVEWNGQNFDLDQHPYLRWCYDNKKWAFLSDFARLLIIYQEGGIYFDTDVEMLKCPDHLLNCGAFFGFENDTNINTGEGFGAVAGHPAIEAMIKEYTGLQPNSAGEYPLVVCPALNTKGLMAFGLELNGCRQTLGDIEIYPVDYFNPYDDPTGRLNKTANTVSVHWYSKSWMDKKTILRSKITKPIHRIFGTDCFAWLKRKSK